MSDLISREAAKQIARNRASHAKGETARACKGIEVSIDMLPAAQTDSDAAARIEQLERELAEAQGEGDQWRDLALKRGDQLSAERALADRLWTDIVQRIGMKTPATEAYRKARGL